MKIINANNVNDALTKGLLLLDQFGVAQKSRNGPVVKVNTPVATVTEYPDQRVLFHPWRDANPFFHFYESLWMLAGRNDVAPLVRYVKRMAEYSDDGITQNAAYGHRWRSARSSGLYSVDQLEIIVEELRSNPRSRQCVLQIWDHERDLGTTTKDHACNVAATFQIDHFGCLEMVVFCRSNDAIWGCHGANAVHFSVLMEYVARSVGVRLGTMTQISVNYHAYVDIYKKIFDGYRATWRAEDGRWIRPICDPYRSITTDQPRVESYPLMSVPREKWDHDVRKFVTDDGRLPGKYVFSDPFFTEVAWPIVRAHEIYKDYNDVGAAIAALDDCKASDWRLACVQWLERRRTSR